MIHNKSSHKNTHKCTMHGLQHWFEAKFEKLGWMALAKEHGNDLKVRAYLQSVSHLKDCIKDKIASVHDEDRKDDLEIMLEHTETLYTAAHKLLDSDLTECSKNKKHTMKDGYEATFYGLHKWEAKMFEKLGWMVLSKKEDNSLKIKSYFHSIHLLKSSLKKKLDVVEEKDRNDDLKILYDDVCILWCAASKILCKPEKMGSMSSSHSIHSSDSSDSSVSSDSTDSQHSKHYGVHSDEVPKGMVMYIDNKGHKHFEKITKSHIKKHMKERHVRHDRDAPNQLKKTKKTKKSKKSHKTKTSKKNNKKSDSFLSIF